MIQKVFAVYDSKACAFLQPFFSDAAGSAIRAFGDAANEDKSPISRHPGDYQLYEIGSFDNSSAMLTPVIPTRLLGCAADFVTVKVSKDIGVPYVPHTLESTLAQMDSNHGS